MSILDRFRHLRGERLRVASIGAVGPQFGDRIATDLLTTAGQGTPDTALTVDLALVPGASLGGPGQLRGPVVDAFIHCEVSSVPTVLLAAHPDDLSTPVAAVCRDVASEHPEVIVAARQQFGA
jgi:hypothetical protein